MRHERSLLAFKEDAPSLQCLQIMPYILRDIYTISAILLAEDNTFNHRSIIFISGNFHPPPQYHKCLFFRRMPMYLNLRSWLHSIQESMALIFQRLMEVCSLSLSDCFACRITSSNSCLSIIFITHLTAYIVYSFALAVTSSTIFLSTNILYLLYLASFLHVPLTCPHATLSSHRRSHSIEHYHREKTQEIRTIINSQKLVLLLSANSH